MTESRPSNKPAIGATEGAGATDWSPEAGSDTRTREPAGTFDTTVVDPPGQSTSMRT